MTAHSIDGKAFAAKLRLQVADTAESFSRQAGRAAGLAVVLVGDDAASQVYVGSKIRACNEVGIRSFEHRLPADASTEDVLSLVTELNQNEAVDGILVQLPLPKQIDEAVIIGAIDVDKDVDGFHVVNAGRLATGAPGLVPCTPFGCLMLLQDYLGNLEGLHAVVIGRSNIVGKPMARLLLDANCTVTVAHSRTRDLQKILADADIVVAAVGSPRAIRGEWLKPGATVIDVGINRVPDSSKASGTRLVGDVDAESAAEVAGALTPVPGGVGPMTIAVLLHQTVQAAFRRQGLESHQGESLTAQIA